ncbi:UDP-N-acetylmuramoyl-L-alanine--D-glutamate ligase [Gimesia fumaroli]|uniref:UDP-N-acetylmuramoylalanine--D-glutamate ligase n=1 Tax=Gimesia fumaroli TaxID=2527976 RepID=A0A518IDA8_9PLAN|nr:UDP-N-acetylmuramoyl-L-alanine--D-glutamate ligase [Gimesia fumaroli]QDV51065.1 UDP-N-acetylmuramoylalanine--D-glutamate ligase MurD [Gimesia fumaroli]
MPLKPFLIQDFELKGRLITLLGLGRFGGGVAAVRYLAAQGAQITVIDGKDEASLTDSLQQLESLSQVKYQLGSETHELPKTDLLVVNPAIPPCHPLLKNAEELQIPVTSEMELFWQLNPARVIGVTGSNGKSTTTAMIHAIMQASGARCWLGGNIGISLLPVVDQIQPDDWVILELSSFQLEALNRIQASPQIGVVTNFSPNHLDWHQTVEHYRESKQTIFRWQTQNDFSILNADEGELQNWSAAGKVVRYGAAPDTQLDLLIKGEAFELTKQNYTILPHLNVPGMHNRMNAAAAIAACTCASVEVAAIQVGLKNFEGLPHRLQFVGEFLERRFYNDSLATTPESAICALDAFKDCPIILLAGGSDKKVDLTDFATQILKHSKATALMGETGPVLSELMYNLKERSDVNSSTVISPQQTSFEAAFDWAIRQSGPGDVILLSPGCASYGWFSSFVERGERFVKLFFELNARMRDSTE